MLSRHITHYNLVKILRCLNCSASLRAETNHLVCEKCKQKFPIKRNIPVMLNSNSQIASEKFVQTFYNQFPYNIDANENYSKENLPVGQLPDYLFKNVDRSQTIIDVGCGVGRYLRLLRYLDCSPIGVDQSLQTLFEVKSEMKGVELLNASNLNLPIKDDVGDWIISAGVIHHTGDTRKAFSELVRICKPSGRIYLMVYQKWSNYYLIYTTVGSLLRLIYFSIPLGKIFSRQVLMPLFNIVDNLVNRKGRTLNKSISLYADYFLQPIATFHTNEQLASWCKEEGVKCKLYPKNHPTMVSLILTK